CAGAREDPSATVPLLPLAARIEQPCRLSEQTGGVARVVEVAAAELLLGFRGILQQVVALLEAAHALTALDALDEGVPGVSSPSPLDPLEGRRPSLPLIGAGEAQRLVVEA